MKSFFVTIGKGILYLLLAPFVLVAFVCFTVYSFFVFIIQFIKSVIFFFKGEKISKKTPEDLEAERVLNHVESEANGENNPAPAPIQTNNNTDNSTTTTNQTIINNIYVTPETMAKNPGMINGFPYPNGLANTPSMGNLEHNEPEQIETNPEPEQIPVLNEEGNEDEPF